MNCLIQNWKNTNHWNKYAVRCTKMSKFDQVERKFEMGYNPEVQIQLHFIILLHYIIHVMNGNTVMEGKYDKTFSKVLSLWFHWYHSKSSQSKCWTNRIERQEQNDDILKSMELKANTRGVYGISCFQLQYMGWILDVLRRSGLCSLQGTDYPKFDSAHLSCACAHKTSTAYAHTANQTIHYH